MRKRCRTKGRCPTLGSFFNSFNNEFIPNNNQSIPLRRRDLAVSPICQVLNGDELSTERLLDTLQIDQQQRLEHSFNPDRDIGVKAILDIVARCNKNTRVLYYQWERQVDFCAEPETFAEGIERWYKYPSNATDLVESVTRGIEFILVLQLASDTENVEQVDQTFKKVADELMRDKPSLRQIGKHQRELLGSRRQYEIYSNLSDLPRGSCLVKLAEQIQKIGRSDASSPPLHFDLRPIGTITTFLMPYLVTCDRSPVERIDNQTLALAMQMDDSRAFWNPQRLEAMGKNFHELFGRIFAQYSALLEKRKGMIEQWQKLSMEARSSISKYFEIVSFSKNEEWRRFHDELNDFIDRVKPIKKTEGLIRELELLRIAYIDVSRYLFEVNTSLKTIRRKLREDRPQHHIICSNSTLNRACCDQWVRLCADSIQQQNKNSELLLTYADFSYSDFRLDSILHLSPEDNDAERDDSKTLRCSSESAPVDGVLAVDQREDTRSISRKPSWSSTTSEEHSPLNDAVILTEESDDSVYDSDRPSIPPVPYVNVLLVGESGVGKSTFINALANYLRFPSLNDALLKPEVVIPVSFLITTGFNFDEKILYFGDCKNPENEDFNEQGHSVTQQCREYEFNLPSHGGKRIRIIDTPGFGDTRGLEQDQKNIDHIKDYIKRYPSLDAICFLLKPNEARLSIAFRTCWIQFANVLSKAEHQKLIFCFTNARSTFYSPGNTGPLVRKMLVDWQMEHIPFRKQNVFCFDNESFRYLVATRNGVAFNADEQEQYERSWEISVKEATRLLGHILDVQQLPLQPSPPSPIDSGNQLISVPS